MRDLFEELGRHPRGGEPERLNTILQRVLARIEDHVDGTESEVQVEVASEPRTQWDPDDDKEPGPGPDPPGIDRWREVFMVHLEDQRRRRGWSRAELGRRARVDPSFLAKVEGGRVRPYPVQLRRLARALGWPARDGAGLLDEVTPGANTEPPAA